MTKAKRSEQDVWRIPFEFFYKHQTCHINMRGLHTNEQSDINSSMSPVRVPVEWVFAYVNYVSFFEFKKNFINRFKSCGRVYVVGALLRNARMCLYGTSEVLTSIYSH